MAHTTRNLNWASKCIIFRWHGYVCVHCGKKFPMAKLTADHIIPHSKGGSRAWVNLVPACYPCNQNRADLTLSDEIIIQYKEMAERAFEHLLEMRNGHHAVIHYRRQKTLDNGGP